MITFEELAGMFDAKEIDFNTYEKEEELNDAFGAGRGYAVARWSSWSDQGMY